MNMKIKIGDIWASKNFKKDGDARELVNVSIEEDKVVWSGTFIRFLERRRKPQILNTKSGPVVNDLDELCECLDIEKNLIIESIESAESGGMS